MNERDRVLRYIGDRLRFASVGSFDLTLTRPGPLVDQEELSVLQQAISQTRDYILTRGHPSIDWPPDKLEKILGVDNVTGLFGYQAGGFYGIAKQGTDHKGILFMEGNDERGVYIRALVDSFLSVDLYILFPNKLLFSILKIPLEALTIEEYIIIQNLYTQYMAHGSRLNYYG